MHARGSWVPSAAQRPEHKPPMAAELTGERLPVSPGRFDSLPDSSGSSECFGPSPARGNSWSVIDFLAGGPQALWDISGLTRPVALSAVGLYQSLWSRDVCPCFRPRLLPPPGPRTSGPIQDITLAHLSSSHWPHCLPLYWLIYTCLLSCFSCV